jgi:hypothetical protein
LIKSNGNGNSIENVSQFNTDARQLNSEAAVNWNYAPAADWSQMCDTEHFVQFYEADGFLLNSLSGFIGNALSSGDGAIVVATPAHRNGLDELLQANGLDLTSVKARGQYVSLDAVETLSSWSMERRNLSAFISSWVA